MLEYFFFRWHEVGGGETFSFERTMKFDSSQLKFFVSSSSSQCREMICMKRFIHLWCVGIYNLKLVFARLCEHSTRGIVCAIIIIIVIIIVLSFFCARDMLLSFLLMKTDGCKLANKHSNIIVCIDANTNTLTDYEHQWVRVQYYMSMNMRNG